MMMLMLMLNYYYLSHCYMAVSYAHTKYFMKYFTPKNFTKFYITSCKDDQQSQWEMPYFEVCQHRNPWVDFQKKITVDYVGDPTPRASIGCHNRFEGGVSAHAWNCHPQASIFLFFRFHAPRYRSARWTDCRQGHREFPGIGVSPNSRREFPGILHDKPVCFNIGLFNTGLYLILLQTV